MVDFSGIKAVIFDIDGTLMDSVGRIVKTMQLSFRELGLAEPDAAAVKNVIGLSLREVAEELLPDAELPVRQALVAAYRKNYTLLEDREPTELFRDAVPFLRELRTRGFHVGLATGKSRKGCRRVLEGYGLSQYVDVSVAGDEFPSKPAPDMLWAAAGMLGLPAASCLMAGDSELDLMMAERAGMPGAGVLTGVHDRERLASCHPIVIAENLTELRKVLLGERRDSGAPGALSLPGAKPGRAVRTINESPGMLKEILT
ncbi:HAD family hydrolase [Succinimonas sp.]|uniref:HAD family hydrolase n=1 Tax=Succinimonas sp. TaxID=1936151 RepID=UPI0038702825